MSNSTEQKEHEPLRVLFCIGLLQPLLDTEVERIPPVIEAVSQAFDDLAGRFGVTVLGTIDDDQLVYGPATTYPWTAYVLADAPDLSAVKAVCALLRETRVGDHLLGRYLRLEARIGRPLFFATS